MLSRGDACYHIVKINSRRKNTQRILFFSLFAFSSGVVLIRNHMQSDQQHSLIKKKSQISWRGLKICRQLSTIQPQTITNFQRYS